MKNHLARRVRERKELRLQILDAARELIEANGEESITLRQVARKVEHSAATIYLYFPDKRTLVAELCALDFAAHSRLFKQAERLSDPIERLKKTALAYLDFGLQHPHHYQAMFMTVQVAPEASSAAEEPSAYDYLHSAVFKALAADCLFPELLDAHQVAQTLWSGLHGTVSLHLIRSSHPKIPWRPIEQSASATVECLLRGILREKSAG